MTQLFALILFHVLTILFYSALFLLYRRKRIVSLFTCIDVVYCVLAGLEYYFIFNNAVLIEEKISNILANSIYLPLKLLTQYLTQKEIICNSLFLFIFLITIFSFRIWVYVKCIESDLKEKFILLPLLLAILTIFLPIGLLNFNILF